jgi:hypothetical protein
MKEHAILFSTEMVGNGVPLSMGRAIAKAVRKATA